LAGRQSERAERSGGLPGGIGRRAQPEHGVTGDRRRSLGRGVARCGPERPPGGQLGRDERGVGNRQERRPGDNRLDRGDRFAAGDTPGRLAGTGGRVEQGDLVTAVDDDSLTLESATGR